ncbi:MAG: GDP-L-fucose synthase [Gammaproteobacteria bacterium]|nr:GDP-L-fucose synthase [Gammaproteobacteria bacterium]
MDKNAKIFIAGHRGLVGSALQRKLIELGYNNLILEPHQKLDLTRQADVENFFHDKGIEYVFIAAAKVGGIVANNTYGAEFIYQNLMIEANIIHAAYLNKVKKLLFLGSSCIYPKFAKQPIKEEYLLTGSLEPTNEAYAIAKIAGIELCNHYKKQYRCNFISAMPSNLYGVNDNFDLQNSHVLPGLIRKFHEAKLKDEKEVIIWGSGTPKREFLYVDDLAEALIFLMDNYNDAMHINVGTGEDISIIELAALIKKVVGFKGKITHDLSKPDGTPRKLLDVTKINNLGWKYKTSLEAGIRQVYKWFLEDWCPGPESNRHDR